MLPFPIGNLEILTYIATRAAVAQLTVRGGKGKGKGVNGKKM
jgi:hypothetical protein